MLQFRGPVSVSQVRPDVHARRRLGSGEGGRWSPQPLPTRPHTPVPSLPAFVPTSGISLHSSLLLLLCKEPVGIFGFKKEKLFLSSSPLVISFLLVVPILHLARQPGV